MSRKGLRHEPWMDGAVCVSVDSEIFFPVKGASNNDAKRICYRCPVRSDCLRYAMDNDERYGIYGGLSAWERTRLARSRRAA